MDGVEVGIHGFAQLLSPHSTQITKKIKRKHNEIWHKPKTENIETLDNLALDTILLWGLLIHWGIKI